jgi:hypothetical protein
MVGLFRLPGRPWLRRVGVVSISLLAVAGAADGGARVAASSDSRSGTLTAPTSSVSWSQSATMTGTAPARRDAMCAAPTHPCDDFNLTISRGIHTAAVDITVTPSAGADMSIAVYPPGCSGEPTNPTACYTLYGATAQLLSPANGTYLIRMACNTCLAATYNATARLGPLPRFHLPPAGNQTFQWARQRLISDATTPSGEPGISINRLGHEIVNSFGPTVWISTDNGHTFGPPDLIVDPICASLSGDADAVVANDDTYYADNLCVAGPTNLSYSSTDGGKTWNAGQGNLPTLPGLATDSDRQWYALDPTDPAILYFSYHDLAGPNIWVNKSVDHGKTWLQQVPITLAAPNFVDTGAGNTSARPLVDPSDHNTVLVFYTSNHAINSALAPPTNDDFDLTQIYMAKSVDGGKTWTNQLVFDAGTTNGQDNTIAHEFSSAAIDSAGNAYVVFSERLGDKTQTHIEYIAIPKGSTANATPRQVDQGGLGANVFPWIAAGDPGRVDITWYGSPSQDNNDPQSHWSEMFSQTLNGLSATPTFTQSRVSGGRPMHAADICLAGTLCLVTGGNRNLADFQMIAIDPCGLAQMVWTDDSNGTGFTMHARQTTGAGLLVKGCGKTVAPVPKTQPAKKAILPGTGVGGSLMPSLLLVVAAGALGAWRRRAWADGGRPTEVKVPKEL